MDRAIARTLISRLNRDAEHIAWRFGLQYKSIEAERANVTSRYGVCYDDGVIKIRLRHAVTGSPLRYSSLVSTLCHELAHLRHFNHGDRFRIFYRQLLEFARAEGLYRPRSGRGGARPAPGRPSRRGRDEAVLGPQQLTLF
jgi:predicted metal-dependent hydrolase